jgi:UDP-N-acetylmuramoylalanine-D-glutamate ligase
VRLALARGADVVGVDRNLDCKPLEGDPAIELPSEYHRRGDGGDADANNSAGWARTAGEDTAGRILRTELGPHRDAAFAAADVIVLSPGVPLTQPQVAAALLWSQSQDAVHRNGSGGGGGCIVVSELAFASQCLPATLPVAAVTGTNGKSTVCTFVGQLLASCGAEVFVGGNLGTPLSDCALDFVAAARRGRRLGQEGRTTWPYDAVVVECSSYQLVWGFALSTPITNATRPCVPHLPFVLSPAQVLTRGGAGNKIELNAGSEGSYLQEHPGALRFDVACVINLTPDHMERHGSMEAYATAKARIFAALKEPGNTAVLPAIAGDGDGDGDGAGADPVEPPSTASTSALSTDDGGNDRGGASSGDGGENSKEAASLEKARLASGAARVVDWESVGATILEQGRAAVIQATTTVCGGGPGGVDVGAVGGRLVRIGSLPGVVVDLSAMTATVQLPGGNAGASEPAGDHPVAASTSVEPSVVDLSPLTAVGTHNAKNAGVALLLAHALDPIRYPVARLAVGLALLTPPPHRMQLVATTLGEVQWMDDSKATNVEAAAAGLRGYGRRAVVLLGGMAKEGVGPGGKGLGFAALVPALQHHQAVVTFGGSGAAIAAELRAAGFEPRWGATRSDVQKGISSKRMRTPRSWVEEALM